jgi:hypothetical protein
MQRAWTWLGVLALLAAGRIVSAGDGGANPVFTNKVHFRIPFRSDAAEMQRLDAREVQLYVSTDQGTRWRMVDKAEPRNDHFDYVAPADGEYWFAVRTLDGFNRLHPQGNNIEPGLKVIVDATPPVLELLLTEVEPGKIELRWTAADDHLDPTRLRLEYHQPDTPEWQQVGVVPQASGQTTWTVPAGGHVAVRGSITDLAGNTVNAERDLTVRPSAHGPQDKAGAAYGQPVATTPKPPGTAQTASDVSRDLFSGAAASSSGGKADQEFFEANDSGPRIAPKGRDELVSDTRTPQPPIGPPGLAAPSTSPAAPPQQPSTLPSSPAGDEPPHDDFGPPTSSASAPSPNASAKDDSAAPRTIIVNNRDFKIGYRVDDVGPSGLGKVDLYITQDSGRKWYHYGTDPDNKSPFAVTVPEDGVYGFEIRVKNGAGIGDDPPKPGDKPSIVVTVDKTPPAVEFLPPQIGRGASRNKVLLRWTASDTNLASAPVLLEYAAEQAGPWQKIGDWQANSGRFIWSLERGLPGKVYLRVTVKDEAGNVTQVPSTEPLLIDFVRPTARIVDVEAKAENAPRN